MSRLRFWGRYDRTPVVELGRSNPVRMGAAVLVLALIVVYFGVTKHVPFKHGFRLKAVFSTAVNVRSSSPVRVAGVDVGKVSGWPARATRGSSRWKSNRTACRSTPMRR
jgi:hypothetical protein